MTRPIDLLCERRQSPNGGTATVPVDRKVVLALLEMVSKVAKETYRYELVLTEADLQLIYDLQFCYRDLMPQASYRHSWPDPSLRSGA